MVLYTVCVGDDRLGVILFHGDQCLHLWCVLARGRAPACCAKAAVVLYTVCVGDDRLGVILFHGDQCLHLWCVLARGRASAY